MTGDDLFRDMAPRGAGAERPGTVASTPIIGIDGVYSARPELRDLAGLAL